MKIAILSFYSGHFLRGVETWTYELANRLAVGHEVTVYQNGESYPSSKYKTVEIKKTVDWKKKQSSLSFLNYYSLRVKDFTQEVLEQIDSDTDIVIPTNGQWQSLLCSWWAKRNGKRIVICGHSGPGKDDRINLFTFPDAFVALTEHQKLWAKRANPFVKVQKIPNGIDLDVFKPMPRGKNNLPGPVILNVAALVDWKRQKLIIEAVSKLPTGSLLLVGKGIDQESLTKLGEKLLPGRFKIISAKYKDMPDIYRSADLFTYPSVPWESFGIAILEAMASGLPVVATKDEIRREIVGDAGFLVDPTDTDAYAAALQKALDTKWGDKPRKQAEKFSWERVAKQYEELFDKLIK